MYGRLKFSIVSHRQIWRWSTETNLRLSSVKGNLTLTLFECYFRTTLDCASWGRIPHSNRNHSLHRELAAGQVPTFSGRSCCSAASDGNQPASAHRTQKEEGPWHTRYVVVDSPINLDQILVAYTNRCFLSFSGYVLGILMMAVIIVLGAGITIGYFYKRSVSTNPKIVNLTI